MKKNNYIMLFSLIMCIFTSISLSWCFTALKERRDFNEELDKQKNILNSAGIKIKDNKQINIIFKETTKIIQVNKNGDQIKENDNNKNSLILYKIFNKEENSNIYVYPIKGKGLWSTIEGYLAVYEDGKKIKGVNFSKHGETPGLGAEIEKKWFTDNFINKNLYFNNTLIGIEVVKGKAKDNPQFKIKKDNLVDGISGATITGNGISKMIKNEPKKYQLFFEKQIKSSVTNGSIKNE